MDDARAAALKPKDFRSDVTPIWCPGCGHFGVQAALTRAFAELGLRPEELVIVSGIGCSSRVPAYINAYGFHGVHGRALAVAAGVKLARPELTVVAAGGDGDGFSIGGNHFLHACRRNVDMAYIVMDNEIYGMTKGQPSPTTPPDRDSALSPGGTGIGAFRPAAVALASGAPFIARGFAGDPNGLARMLMEAIRYPGFAFVHVLSHCVTYCPEQRDWKQSVHAADGGTPADAGEAARLLMTDDGLTTGIFFAADRPAYAPLPARGTAGEAAALAAIERELAI
jgi:2-oxoglutarate ferredoxin oxidoreductase subunit beta